MKKKKYILMVDLIINGKKSRVSLANYDLIALQKYTSFCNGPNDLLKFMPSDKEFSVRNFLLSHINQIKEDGYDPFSIRTSTSNKSKEIRIIYNNDTDVLLAGMKTLEDRIGNSFRLNIDDCVSGSIDSNIKEILIKLYERFSDRNLARAIDDVMISKLNMDGFYDKRYEVAMRNRWMFIGLSPKCRRALVKDAFLDDRKRIELAFFLKDNTGDLLPFMSSYEKSKAIEKLNEALSRRKASSTFIRNSIRNNILNLSSSLKNQENTCIKITSPSVITESEVIEYNKNRFLEEKSDVLLERIIFISEKIENLKCILETLIKEEKELEKLLKQGSFIECDDSIAQRLENVRELIKLKKREISVLEYESNELENGKVTFSDAGFLIEEKDKNMWFLSFLLYNYFGDSNEREFIVFFKFYY